MDLHQCADEIRSVKAKVASVAFDAERLGGRSSIYILALAEEITEHLDELDGYLRTGERRTVWPNRSAGTLPTFDEPPLDVDAPPRRTGVYRFFDSNGRLLYVGVAYDPDARERQHRATKRWSRLIVSRTVDWYLDRETALLAEQVAIANEDPIFNEAGNAPLRVPE